MPFDLKKLIRDVFDPLPGERIMIMVDDPHDMVPDNAEWRGRREMACQWHDTLAAAGYSLLPMIHYPATGANNGDLPDLSAELAPANILLAMTEFSATAPLVALVRQRSDLRVASMPGVLKRMEQTALAADYAVVARLVRSIQERLAKAQFVKVTFSTGQACLFDIRHRTPHADDGVCTASKKGVRLINLPSGEAFIVPYEGEIDGDPSRTKGHIPVDQNGDIVVLQVANNLVVDVSGPPAAAKAFQDVLAVDPARRNIAELGFGCNAWAVVTGNVLEDEKAGFHWAYGRSEHLGGVIGPGQFTNPAHVLHQDVVYASRSPIMAQEIVFEDGAGHRDVVMFDGVYTHT